MIINWWCWMTIILEKYVRVCFLQPILTQSISEVATLPMCLRFFINRVELFWKCGIFSYSNHQSSRLIKNLLYFIQWVMLKYHHIEYASFKYWYILLSCSYLNNNKITSIKSDMSRNLTNLKDLKVFLLFYFMLSLTIHVYLQFI